MKSVTERPVSLHIFCATVLSVRMAWSELRSCLNWRLPKCSTADTTRNTAARAGDGSSTTRATPALAPASRPGTDPR